MSDYSRWINWFRNVSPIRSSAPPARSTGVPSYDAERFGRVLYGGNGTTAARHVGLIESLSSSQRMINWLKTQPPGVVDAFAQHLNWDRAEEVILWLLAQPTTDAATAVKLFMRAEPAYYIENMAEKPSDEPPEFEQQIIQIFTANWTANRYSRGGVGYDPSEVSEFGTSDIFFINELNQTIARLRSTGVYPSPTLRGLAGPFIGPKPRELEMYLKAMDRSELFFVRFLFAGLGTWITDENINEMDFDEWMQKNGLSTD